MSTNSSFCEVIATINPLAEISTLPPNPKSSPPLLCSLASSLWRYIPKSGLHASIVKGTFDGDRREPECHAHHGEDEGRPHLIMLVLLGIGCRVDQIIIFVRGKGQVTMI